MTVSALLVALVIFLLVLAFWHLVHRLSRFHAVASGIFAWQGVRLEKVLDRLPPCQEMSHMGMPLDWQPVEITERLTVIHFASGRIFETERHLDIGWPPGTPIIILRNAFGQIRVERDAKDD